MNVIHYLRTPLTTLIVLCAALVAQLPHAADVFRLIVAGDGWWAVAHSYSYAVALELAVLLFVVQGRNKESYVFAGVSVCINLSYYALHGVQLFSVAALPAILVSVALPVSIALYSHLLARVGDAPVAVATEVSAASDADATPVVAPVARDVAAFAALQPSARVQALQMAEEGCTVTQIAAQVGAKPATVRSWIARERAQRNGGTHA